MAKNSQRSCSDRAGRAEIPQVFKPNKFKFIIENIEKYDIVLLLYENEHKNTIKDAINGEFLDKTNLKVALIVGPEGGLSDEEVSKLIEYKNVKCVTLGNRILRTETAGLSAVSMLIYEFEM